MVHSDELRIPHAAAAESCGTENEKNHISEETQLSATAAHVKRMS